MIWVRGNLRVLRVLKGVLLIMMEVLLMDVSLAMDVRNVEVLPFVGSDNGENFFSQF